MVASLPENEGLPPHTLQGLTIKATEQVYGAADSSLCENLRQSCGVVIVTMNKMATAMQEGEYDSNSPPIKVRYPHPHPQPHPHLYYIFMLLYYKTLVRPQLETVFSSGHYTLGRMSRHWRGCKADLPEWYQE
uniref:Uncharacterized protein n=1 Tax=Callorhinchus milii TaxID=7868 RepID=A0A4W3H660_CALMI